MAYGARGLPLIGLMVCAGCVNLPRTLGPAAIFPPPNAVGPVEELPKDAVGAVCVPQPLLADGRIPSELTQFAVAMHCAYQRLPGDKDFTPWMQRFVSKGLALSDHSCERFFDQLEALRVEASYTQTNMNVGAAALTAMLAISSTHSRAVFNLATSLAAGNAWYENYKGNYLMSPQTQKMHALIQNDLRAPLHQQILAKSQAKGYRSFDEAKVDLMKYDALCSHKSIQEVLTQAIASTRLQPFVPRVNAKNEQEADPVRSDIFKIASGGAAGQFAGAELEALYVVATLPTWEERKQAVSALTEVDAKLALAMNNLDLSAADVPASTVALFQQANHLLKFNDSAVVATLRAQLHQLVPPAGNPPRPEGVMLRPDGLEASANRPDPAVVKKALKETLQTPPHQATGPIDFRWQVLDHQRQ